MKSHISGICENCDNLHCAIINSDNDLDNVPEILECEDYLAYSKTNPSKFEKPHDQT